MNTLRRQVKKLEEVVQEKDQAPIYRWDDGTLSEAELLKGIAPEDMGRVVIFQWNLQGEDEYPNRPEVPREPSPISAIEPKGNLDTEILEAIRTARESGASEKEIREALQEAPAVWQISAKPAREEEPQGQGGELVRLMGGAKKGYHIDRG